MIPTVEAHAGNCRMAKMIGCLQIIRLGWVSRSLFPTENQSQPWGEKWPKCRFEPNFSWAGLALGWGVRRFHNHIRMFSKPT